MKRLVACLVLLTTLYTASAQKVIYSEPDRNDYRQTEFEIIGKVSGNILIYKSTRGSAYAMSVYDTELKQKDRVKLDFLPDRIINADFLAYSDYCYMFYQYQRRNVVYSMAAKIGGDGKIIGQPITMDTTEISFLASNRIYSVVNSDDKQYIGLFKVNSKNEDNFYLTTVIYNKDLEKKEKQYMQIPMPDRHDYLTEFVIDNDADFAFVRAIQSQENDKVNVMEIKVKKYGSNEIVSNAIGLNEMGLDDVKLKVDNYNRKYIISSFYSKTRRGNIEGLYNCIWDKLTNTGKASMITFDENLRSEARGDNGMRSAFNDYSIRNMIVRKDGGFILAAESFFSTGRGGANNRYDYVYGSPFLRPMDYYMFNPYSGYGYPWYRYNSFGQSTRYNAQNIAVFSFDSTGKIDWRDVITKNQYDDETDAFIGYSLVNTGDQVHFLFNQQEKRMQLLSDQSISPDGKVSRNPTLKNLDQGFDFMARYGKQIGSRQIIFPCMFRNYLCFARLDL